LGTESSRIGIDRQFKPALCIVGSSPVRLWKHSASERLQIQFAAEGVVTIPEQQALSHNGPIIAVRGDAVLDQPLIAILAKRPNLLLLGESPHGPVPVAVHLLTGSLTQWLPVLLGEQPPPPDLPVIIRTPAELNAAFWQSLRKREDPYAFVVAEHNRSEVLWRMFMGTYKGATDFITKRLWPLPAFYVTRALAPTRITPNIVTWIAAVLMGVAFYLFLNGKFSLGLVAAWLMTFLDTVDGKLARTTLTSSRWGDVLDHGIDLVHPPFWYVAWGAGLFAGGFVHNTDFLWWIIGAILVSYVLQRLMEGIAIKGLGLEIHIWRPVDTWFREITARRNPNLALLTLSVLVGRPDWGLIWVAGWSVICLGLHAVQLAHAFFVRMRHGPLRSWMSEPLPRQ
jgi:phosphatidylglycerophosphate synthase